LCVFIAHFNLNVANIIIAIFVISIVGLVLGLR
jgi:hypothetical protein